MKQNKNFPYKHRRICKCGQAYGSDSDNENGRCPLCVKKLMNKTRKRTKKLKNNESNKTNKIKNKKKNKSIYK